MKNLLCLVAWTALSLPWTNGFSSSRRPLSQRTWCSARPVSVSPVATETTHDGDNDNASCPYRDTFELNKALRKLASLKPMTDDDSADSAADLDAEEPSMHHNNKLPANESPASMIARAAACQEEWQKYRQVGHDGGNGVSADIFSLNTVLKAWARCTQFLAEHRNDKSVSLTAAVNNVAVSSPSNSLSPSSSLIYSIYTAQEAAQRAVDLLYEQEALAAKADDIVAPNVASYNICMDAWSKCRRPESPDQVEILFERLQASTTLQPTLLSYNALIDAYAHCDRPDRIERVLELWNEIDQSETIRPTVWTYNSILYTYSRAGKMLYDKQRLLQQQQSQDAASPLETMSPHAAAKESLALLARIKKTYAETNDPADRPDIMTYSIVMEALSRCGSPDMTNKAEELLEEVKRSSYLQPTAYTYSGVLAAWARTKSPGASERADALLQEVLDKKIANTKAFTTTMQAWSRSDSPKKAFRCLELLKQMRDMKALGLRVVSPDSFAYQTAIDACATVHGDATQQNAALRIAFAVFKSMHLDTDVQVTHPIYCSLLNAVARLIPPGEERSRVASAVFEKAAAAHQVDGRVIRALQQGADAGTVQKLLSSTGNQPNNGSKWQQRAQ